MRLLLVAFLAIAAPAVAGGGSHAHEARAETHHHGSHDAHHAPVAAPEPSHEEPAPATPYIPVEVVAAPATPRAGGDLLLVGGVTALGAGLGAAPALWRRLRGVVPFVAALFTRLPRDRLLDLDARRRVHAAVAADPGLGVEACARRLGLARTTVDYHARLLERGGLIRSRREGRTRRLYPPDARDATPAVLRVPTACALAAAVREAPGIDQATLARRLDVGPSLVVHHARRLETAGLLRAVKEAGRVRYWPS